MSNVKRYYSFLLGIIAASITWSVVLYLYIRLGNDIRKSLPSKVISANRTVQDAKEKQGYRIENDIVLPYENSLKSLYYQKKKYFKNSEKLVKQLQPAAPVVSNGLGRCDIFRMVVHYLRNFSVSRKCYA